MQFIDLKKQYQIYKEEIDKEIQAACAEANFIFGSRVNKLEEELVAYTGAPHAITCANGTDALQLTLMALDIGPGDEVITSPFTFFATAETIALVGATAVFVDIEDTTYNIDASKIEAAITDKTKAIMPVSIFGQPSDMPAINEIAAKHSTNGRTIHVIEDAAQSFGATFGDKKSCNLSTIATTSFFPAKPLGCYGDGGAIFTSDPEIDAKLRLLRNHGQEGRYDYKYIGINSRLDAIQAGVLSVKLKHFDKEVKARAEVGNRYNELLKDSDITTPFVAADRTSVYAQYCLRHKDRDGKMKALQDVSIPTVIYYPKPLHLQPALADLGHKQGDFPVTEAVADTIFAVPMHPFLEEADQKTIASVLLG